MTTRSAWPASSAFGPVGFAKTAPECGRNAACNPAPRRPRDSGMQAAAAGAICPRQIRAAGRFGVHSYIVDALFLAGPTIRAAGTTKTTNGWARCRFWRRSWRCSANGVYKPFRLWPSSSTGGMVPGRSGMQRNAAIPGPPTAPRCRFGRGRQGATQPDIAVQTWHPPHPDAGGGGRRDLADSGSTLYRRRAFPGPRQIRAAGTKNHKWMG